MISIIAAVAENRAIGNGNKLIYWLPNDMKRFRLLTTGHTIIMGRNTYLSLPKGALPNRRNIVVTTTIREFPRCECYPSIEEALSHCNVEESLFHGLDDNHVYIIGGARVYEQAIAFADRLCLTEVRDTPAEADTFFPDYSTGWREVSRECHPADEQHAFAYDFVDYVTLPSRLHE